jgi:ABC-2 type transport system ATP-binding protein
MRLKANPAPFAERLTMLGCRTRLHDELIIVELPQGSSPQMLWELARDQQEQIRYLRPQRSTLEEVFLKAVEQP